MMSRKQRLDLVHATIEAGVTRSHGNAPRYFRAGALRAAVDLELVDVLREILEELSGIRGELAEQTKLVAASGVHAGIHEPLLKEEEKGETGPTLGDVATMAAEFPDDRLRERGVDEE